MKSISVVFLFSIFLLAGCNQVMELVSELSNISKSETKSEEFIKKLKGLDPITPDQIKAWMPTALDGMVLDSKTLPGTYPKGHPHENDIASLRMTFDAAENNISVYIVDGAGKRGKRVGLFLMLYDILKDKKTENGYKRKETIDGKHVIVEYLSSPEKTSMTYIENERFLIKITGNVNPTRLWELNKKLKFDKLII